MTASLAPFAAVDALIAQGVGQALSNATATWHDGPVFGVHLYQGAADGFGEVVTTKRHTVSLCVLNAPGLAEGSTGLRINGQPCHITGAVVPDAGGWTTFTVVFTEGAHAGP